MSLIYKNSVERPLPLQEREKPELYRDMFPYSRIGRIEFNDRVYMPKPAETCFITDTTFRDGQQARPPYTVHQIAKIFDLLHKLGGKSGLIQASEFFMYSKKDRKAIETCRSRGYRFPIVTGWIRANLDDLKLAKDMEFNEVGMLTSVSDYHIYLKLGKNRQQAMDDYVKLASQALEWGIVPRCHFEDITRADIFGFCLPFAKKLMELSKQAFMPVKIRLCDTMGFGVPYAGASLPRSVQGIIRSFIEEAGVPENWLEWHGHNDFHKVLVNGVTAWLYGCASVNGALLGFGERTGNTPVEALVMEYISLTGDDSAADTTVISEIASFFENELGYVIPPNYPFVGAEFNATSAGVHVDGLAKNEEIYNIFDTNTILGKPVPIIITDKSGRAGVAYWINHFCKLEGDAKVTKQHPAVGQIYAIISKDYEEGRNTSFSTKEMLALTKRFFPELFVTELQNIKKLAGQLASQIVDKLAQTCKADPNHGPSSIAMENFMKNYPFIQFLNLTDKNGALIKGLTTSPSDTVKYAELLAEGYNFGDRIWFMEAIKKGKLYISDLYQSLFTKHLIITVSQVVTDDKDEITGVISADIQLEELIKRASALEAEYDTEHADL